MPYLSRRIACVLIALSAYGAAASADTMRCQTVNGNTTCAGSSGVSCQTINGRKTCVSGHGDVVQSIANPHPTPLNGHDDEPPRDGPAVRRWLEQQGLVPHAPDDAGADDND